MNDSIQILIIAIPIILAIFLSYWGITNNVNQRLDKIYEKISSLNREIGEVDTKTNDLTREMGEANAKIESNFTSVQNKLNDIEKLITSLKL
jgi:peptidoglycan hydrolase CwlO-like protein